MDFIKIIQRSKGYKVIPDTAHTGKYYLLMSRWRYTELYTGPKLNSHTFLKKMKVAILTSTCLTLRALIMFGLKLNKYK